MQIPTIVKSKEILFSAISKEEHTVLSQWVVVPRTKPLLYQIRIGRLLYVSSCSLIQERKSKNFLRKTVLGQGTIAFEQLLRILH